jgi:hypothetical protein
MGQIRPPVAPNLPLAPQEYERGYHDRHDNTLRLYFNQVSNSLQQLLTGFNRYIILLNTASITAAAPNTAYPIAYNTTVESSGITLAGSPASRITVAVAGVYVFLASIQMDSTGGAAHAHTWFRINGVDVANSANKVVVGSGTDESIASRKLMLTLQPGDYVELVWAASNTNLFLAAEAAVAPVPAVPSVRLSVYYLFPDNA